VENVRSVDAIAEILKREGVEYIFCYPTNSMIEAAAAAGIRPVVCRQERVGMGMADGFSRTSNGRPVGVFTSQSGPGAENAFSGVATAYSDSTPVLVLPHGGSMDRLGVVPQFSSARAYESVTKSVEVLNKPDRVSEVLRRAFAGLRTGRPGPVMVEIPDDVANQEVDESKLSYRPPRAYRSGPDPADVDEAARVLLEARDPVIFAGQGILLAEASEDLVELAELLQAPVMTTLLGKSGFPEDHPLALGTAAGVGPGTVGHYLRKGDVFLALGTSLTRHAISSAAIPPGKTIIHATSDPRDLDKEYAPDYAIVGDAKLVTRQLIEAVKDRLDGRQRSEDGAVAQEIAGVREQWLARWMPKLTSEETPINPYRVVWELTKAVDPNNAILTHDSGGPRSQLVPFYRATAPRGYIGFGKSHGLGSGLGLIMGAKLAAPEKFCINYCGDSGFGMVGTDFETAVRNNIPILTVVSNNFEMAVETERMTVSHDRFQTRKTGGNYAEMAKALGGYAERVEKPSEVAAAIERAHRATLDGRAALLEFITSAEYEVSPSRPVD
jgi:acetolactate synthase-1/2/3 large subunit